MRSLLVLLLAVILPTGCKKPAGSGGAPSTTPSSSAPAPTLSVASPSAHPALSAASLGEKPRPACAAAFVRGDTFKIGEDLTSRKAPIRVPAGVAVTIDFRDSGHQITVEGPAAFRPCTEEEPDVFLLVEGKASLEGATTVRPGTEIFVGTPALVAVVARAGIKLNVNEQFVLYEVTSGSVVVNLMELTKTVTSGQSGGEKRFDEGSVLLTRCAVQAAGAASSKRILAELAAPSSKLVLPASSVGILTAERLKHGKERSRNCAFAEAFALACDVEAKGSKAASGGSRDPKNCLFGDKRGYEGARGVIEASEKAESLPEGTPSPSPSMAPSKATPSASTPH